VKNAAGVSRRLSAILAALLLVGLAACSKPVIQGRVVDLFGKPVAGAGVSIPNTAFAATTDAEGKYAIEFAPGQFNLQIQKQGYTSATKPWNLSQAAEVPAADVMLYQVPDEPGIYYVTADHLVPLPRRRINRGSAPIDAWRTRYEYAIGEGKEVAPEVEIGSQARFIESLPAAPHLYEADFHELGVFYRVQRIRTFGTPETPELDHELRPAKTDLGAELRLWSIKVPAQANYVWLPAPPEEAKYGFVFTCPSTEHVD
jgi:hypothetical protein